MSKIISHTHPHYVTVSMNLEDYEEALRRAYVVGWASKDPTIRPENAFNKWFKETKDV